MSGVAVVGCCDALVPLGFFGLLLGLGVCFVAFTWILARSVDAALEVADDTREEGP